MANACYLYSKVNHPVTIKYAGSPLVLSPNARKFLIADESKLGPLPDTVRKVVIREEAK